MELLSTIPGSPGSFASDQEVLVRKATLLHFDGTAEPVLVQQAASPADQTQMAHWHRHLMVTYLVVGTLALSLGAYATIKMLQKSR